MNGPKEPQSRNRLFVAVSRDPSGRWRWEIHRKSHPLCVKFYDDDFESEETAKLDGEKALASFLRHLSREGDDA
jgi:hypothetical protein